MFDIDKRILDINNAICKNIDILRINEKGLMAQNILAQLRNFIEAISLKIYFDSTLMEANDQYSNIEKANQYVSSRADLKFIYTFHKLLQIVSSHYTLNEENSQRLILKYYEYLLRLKNYVYEKYNMIILEKLYLLEPQTDESLKQYYTAIANKIDRLNVEAVKLPTDRYYIQKIKPFFINNRIYYEVTFTVAKDNVSKFDRIIAFTNKDILDNYAVNLLLRNTNINVLNKTMPVVLIADWEVSVRPCEINKFADLFGTHKKIQANSGEYKKLMRYLTTTNSSLLDVVDMKEQDYNNLKIEISKELKVKYIFEILDKARNIITNNYKGTNLLRYLLYKLNHLIIKKQYNSNACDLLSGLYVHNGCNPFDSIPFNTSLKGHNPRIDDLLKCIKIEGREDELFARKIKNNTEINGKIYTAESELENFNNIDQLIYTYNNKLYSGHARRELVKNRKQIYIREYEDDTIKIINRLMELSNEGIVNYSNSVIDWIEQNVYQIDCPEKRKALQQIFENSKVALIYGAAGTGKSTLINHISTFFSSNTKLYLTNTNPALDNLRRKVTAKNCMFRTIASFLANQNCACEVLIIDECSTVSNRDILKILNNAQFKLLVLVGDIYQIESIVFGNWFSIVKSFIPETSVFELKTPYRSSNANLISFWNKVRNMQEDILEHMTKNEYSQKLDESIFDYNGDDEIILCLNYDGLYGINNINKFLQANNPNKTFKWGIFDYKINDPILFNESERFAPLIYNNLKGRIVNIQLLNDRIQFDIEIDKVINQFQANDYDFELLDTSLSGKSVIRFNVFKYVGEDEGDIPSENVVPFQVAYAISIHKAQGLEYDSVKIVITNEVEENITHNIFYTAITRAKKNLKIYWTPETENYVLSNLKLQDNKKDIGLIKGKLKELNL